MYIIINFKTTRVKTWVKISKVMPQSTSISPGKGGKPYGKRSKSLIYNMVWLNRTYYSLFKLQTKFSKLSSPVKFQRITQIPRSSPPQSANSAKFTHFTSCFRHLPWQRTLQNSSELRKFRAVRPHSPRITRNSHILLTYSTLCFRHLPQQRTLSNSSELCKFRAICPHSPRIRRNLHHLLTLHLTFQMPDQWQTTP